MVVILSGLLPIIFFSLFVVFYIQQELVGHLGRKLEIQVEEISTQIDMEFLNSYQELRECTDQLAAGNEAEKSLAAFAKAELRLHENTIHGLYRCLGILSPVGRPPRRTAEVRQRRPSSQALSGRRLHRLATQTDKKCGLRIQNGPDGSG